MWRQPFAVAGANAAAAAISLRSSLHDAICAEDDTLVVDVDPSALGVALVEVALLVDSRRQGDEYARTRLLADDYDGLTRLERELHQMGWRPVMIRGEATGAPFARWFPSAKSEREDGDDVPFSVDHPDFVPAVNEFLRNLMNSPEWGQEDHEEWRFGH